MLESLPVARSIAVEFAGNEPVVGIDGVVLPSGMPGLEPSLLQGKFGLPTSFADLGRTRIDRPRRGLDPERLQHSQHLGGHGLIDTSAPNEMQRCVP